MSSTRRRATRSTLSLLPFLVRPPLQPASWPPAADTLSPSQRACWLASVAESASPLQVASPSPPVLVAMTRSRLWGATVAAAVAAVGVAAAAATAAATATVAGTTTVAGASVRGASTKAVEAAVTAAGAAGPPRPLAPWSRTPPVNARTLRLHLETALRHVPFTDVAAVVQSWLQATAAFPVRGGKVSDFYNGM